MGHGKDPPSAGQDNPSAGCDNPSPSEAGGAHHASGLAEDMEPMPSGIGYDTTQGRAAGFFITPDTTPPGLSLVRPRGIAPLLLLLFATCSAAIDRWIWPMTHAYGRLLQSLAHIPPGTFFGKQSSVAVRPLLLLLALLFALLSAGSVRRRLRLFLTTALTFTLLVMASDLVLMRAALVGGPGPFG
jgi:hypothetical protein